MLTVLINNDKIRSRRINALRCAFRYNKIIEEIVQRECKENQLDTARKMLEKGKYSVEEIAELLELSVSEVENLRKN
ncbi:MAG: hypothetical protein IJ007_04210 [Oscillospiraceae bacterium]|nr:hypothetical protein [Oscillospiraceae bacterium]